MGPRIQIEPDEFMEIVNQEKGLVIKRKPYLLQGMTYVTRSGDYYYYTVTKTPLSLPPDCQVKKVKNILL